MALERIGVIGDIHAEETRLASALRLLEGRGVERILATGDIADGRGSVDACCALLEEHRVITVAGNHDRWFSSGAARNLPQATRASAISETSRAYLARLPQTVELATITGTALLCHGLGTNDLGKVNPDDPAQLVDANKDLQVLLASTRYRWVINGHSHRRMVRGFPGLTLINAGTLKREHAPCFLEIDFRRELVQAFEFDRHGSIGEAPVTLPLV